MGAGALQPSASFEEAYENSATMCITSKPLRIFDLMIFVRTVKYLFTSYTS